MPKRHRRRYRSQMISRPIRLLWLPVVALAVAATAYTVVTVRHPAPAADVTTTAVDWTALAELAEQIQYPRVDNARPLNLPGDLSPHPRARSDAWLLAATVFDAAGERYQLQAVMLRLGLRSPTTPAVDASRWRAQAAWLGRVILSKDDDLTFDDSELRRESALMLAGATADAAGFAVGSIRLSAVGPAGFELDARRAGKRLKLRLHAAKPVLEQAGEGAPLRAFSMTRLDVSGELEGERDGSRTTLRGSAWLDRAWGELPLPGGATRVQRFSLHMGSDRELVVTRTSRRGSTRVRTVGILIDAQGEASQLNRDIELDEVAGAADRPRTWRLQVPSQQLEIQLRSIGPSTAPLVSLLDARTHLRVTGTYAGEAVEGHGYADLADSQT